MLLHLTKSVRGALLSLVLSIITFPALAQQSDPNDFFTLLSAARKHSSDKKWKDAVAAWEQVAERNPVNGEYISNLANAYYYTGQYAQSISFYEKQIELGYGLIYNAAYNIACCYSLIGEKEKALDWLQRSFDMGFHSYTMAQKDDDFNNIRMDPRFAKITAMEDVSKMSRAEGWRYDMEILKKEVMRKTYFRRELTLDAFNKQYDDIYHSVDKKTDIQIILALMKLMASLNDGHTGIFAPSRKEFQIALPLQFYIFKEGLFIIATDEKNKNLLGTKVITMDGKTVEEIRKAIDPMLSRDNEIGVLQTMAGAFRYTMALHGAGLTKHPTKVELNVTDSYGKNFNSIVIADTTAPRVDHKSVPSNWITLHQANGKPVPLYLKKPQSLYWFEKLPQSKMIYLQWNSVRNDKSESLNQFTDRLMRYINENEMDQLVIDLRWNNGGNTMLLPYFINSIIKNERINKRGNLFVITGRRTFSAAQNLATMLEQQTHSVFVGEPTGSSPNFVGEEDFIVLPYSRLAMNVSDLFWQTAWPGDKRTWIAPSIYIPPTFKAYSENRDEALEVVQQVVGAKRRAF